MTVTVRLFGPYAQAAGQPEVTVTLDDTPAPLAYQVMKRLGIEHPALLPLLQAGRLAVNCRYVPDDHPIAMDDELAVIGMVGGG